MRGEERKERRSCAAERETRVDRKREREGEMISRTLIVMFRENPRVLRDCEPKEG